MKVEPRKAFTEGCPAAVQLTGRSAAARVPHSAQDGTVEALCTGGGRLQPCKAPPDSLYQVQDMTSDLCESCANVCALGRDIFKGVTSADSLGPVKPICAPSR